MIAFGNIVLTGLQIRGNTVYMAEAGPTPHVPEDGKIVTFQPGSSSVTQVASGGRLLVDVGSPEARSVRWHRASSRPGTPPVAPRTRTPASFSETTDREGSMWSWRA